MPTGERSRNHGLHCSKGVSSWKSHSNWKELSPGRKCLGSKRSRHPGSSLRPGLTHSAGLTLAVPGTACKLLLQPGQEDGWGDLYRSLPALFSTFQRQQHTICRVMLVAELLHPADASGFAVTSVGLPSVAFGVWFPSPELTLV